MIEIAGVDADGDLLGHPADWPDGEPVPKIYLVTERGAQALAVGDRVLARINRSGDGSYQARPMRRLNAARGEFLGIVTVEDHQISLQPTDRRQGTEFAIADQDASGAVSGELVRAETRPGRRHGRSYAKVIERLGEPGALSAIAISEHRIPCEFPPDALALAARKTSARLDQRTDLRDVPLVTIDDADARDFDDAVWAEPDTSRPDGGWHLIISIADVAWYVRPSDALDGCASERGNSVYFPDRVVPMLPEALSNGWCSLKPNEDRPCVAVHVWIDRGGNKRDHAFVRGLMRSAARLTYDQVQRAVDGDPDAVDRRLKESVVAPLYGAFEALRRARAKRAPLDLDLPERRIVVDENRTIERIERRRVLDSHRLIEEFMITANVAAAETLEKHRRACIYRVHDRPGPDKVHELREIVSTMGLNLARSQDLHPRHFNQIIEKSRGKPFVTTINEAILRAQAQAIYSPNNIGHFGLALARYAHFTSPIRRYADLIVHRALISALNLGDGGLTKDGESGFATAANHVSMTERRAAAAERETLDRMTAAFFADRIGATFDARIASVTRAGLFVALSESGAQGLIPRSMIESGPVRHDRRRLALVGSRSRRVYRLGDSIEVRLLEANVVTGGLLFGLAN